MRSKEGWLMVDHRACGLPGWRGVEEMKTYTCNHCHRIVVVNADRTRERGYCRGCDSVICDNCVAVMAQTLQCRTMDQIVEETLKAAEKQDAMGSPSIILLPN